MVLVLPREKDGGECGRNRGCNEGLLTLAEPYPRIIVLLVGLVFALGVAYLSLQIAFLDLVVILYAGPECPLHVSVDVHLDSAVFDRLGDKVLLGA